MSSRALLSLLLALSLGACGVQSSSPGVDSTSPRAAQWQYTRAEEYPNTAKLPAQYIRMSDGVQLSVQVMLPADAEGKAVSTPLPVVLTQTGYNKSASGAIDDFAFNSFFVRHGYAHVAVDVRGTGTSQGAWEAFSAREQQDYREVMDWVATQSWSDGRVGTWGPSFMGITQIFTAAWQHPAHKAVFAIVPMADAYRDIVFTGGQVNVGFIPLWMGLVTGLGAIPAQPSAQALPIVLEHVLDAVTVFQVPVIAQAALGVNDQNYDSAFWRERSPIEVADRVRTPTFIVGGLHDIFQRGEPLLYEAIRRNTEAKLLIGPWTHLAASFGRGLPADGVPDLDTIALRWFDHYVRGMANGAADMPAVTQYVHGLEHYVSASDWPHPQARAARWYLHGDQSLSLDTPAAGEAAHSTLQIPVEGLCSVSTAQWTAGVLGLLPLPCFQGQNNLNELPLLGAVTYTSAPMAQDYYFNGPIAAELWVASSGTDTSVAVRVTDVDEKGVSTELSNGILTASLRAVDESKSRFLDGANLQPWHPYTAGSRQALTPGEPTRVQIEVFPSSALIKKGHSLRLAISSSDFPHGLPPLTDLSDQLLGTLRIHSDAGHPSSLVLPVVPLAALSGN
ncbi:hypothetical protein SAMN04488038_105241 [Solimonas aquatica]|uniref:Xaa-Pro dipeptidyl-peptidase C-terminal domain-containing protein n=1 Tax=Solimonas aquatica TaxID=489703 RepID=A0A1H9F3X8_9GAMM|nr:CocE/NonD family hydrolase [Solimonas aquatica]SEQ32587.1 hypothetical protein SAMN04488038_105241 [Solimonas aquatica]